VSTATGLPKIRFVKDIEKLGTELKLVRFMDRQVTEE
jgi:hypothetical protein